MNAKRLLIITLILLLILVKGVVNSFAQDKLTGSWQGEFMSGNDFILELHFSELKKLEYTGRVLLFQNKSKIQDNILNNIKLLNKKLAFFIEAKQTYFNGIVDFDNLLIQGEFLFPDSSVHPVSVKKVEKSFVQSLNDNKTIGSKKQKYSLKELQEDFTFFIEKLTDTHPKVYQFTPKSEFKKIVDNKFGQLKKNTTELEFLRIISSINEKVGCFHLGVNMSKALEAELVPVTKLMPFTIKIIDDKVYIAECYIEELDFHSGIELLSINSRAISDIIQKMFDTISADSRNLSSKLYKIETSFPIFYVTKIEVPQKYEIVFQYDSDKKKRSLKLAGLLYPQLMQKYYANHPEKIPSNFPASYKILDGKNTALISIQAFYYSDFDKYFNFIDSVFVDIKEKQIKNLIIDVRGNAGGNPNISSAFLLNLAQKEYQYFAKTEKGKELYPKLVTLQKPGKNAFKGDVFIFIDGGCGSSTGHFLSLVKYHNWATIIGAETGSSFSCNDGSIKLTFPNTKCSFNLPTRTFATAVKGFEIGEPLKPDYEIKYSLNDITNNHDPVMTFALNLIENNK